MFSEILICDVLVEEKRDFWLGMVVVVVVGGFVWDDGVGLMLFNKFCGWIERFFFWCCLVLLLVFIF